MLKNKVLFLVASAALAMPAALHAQGVTPTAGGKGGTVSAEALMARYEAFAGGKENAASLVNGLRTGADITLAGTGPSVPDFQKVLVGQEKYPAGATLPQDGKTRELVRTEQAGFKPCPPPNNLMMCPILVNVYNVYEMQQVGTKPGAPIKETFSPKPAAPMGFGNVDIALALAEAKHRPTATTPSPTELKGTMLEILGKRAAGEGWGDIAKGYGFELK
jgi:hypothetical protein